MGCDWYEATSIIANGTIILYDDKITNFCKLCDDNNFDYSKIKVISYKKNSEDKTVLLFGDILNLVKIEMPGPYIIDSKYYDYNIIDEYKSNLIIPKFLENLTKCKIKEAGKYHIITTGYGDNGVRPNWYD
jgi:hypothetical protein